MKTASIDSSRSLIHWKAFKPGGGHTGTLAIKQGSVSLNDENVPVEGKIIFDMNSINDQDLGPDLKPKLEAHLKSADFFDVEKYPEAEFDIVKVDHTPDLDGFYAVSGNLTVKGIKNEVSFKARYSVAGSEISVVSNVILVDRTKWGINFGSKNIFKKLEEHIIADIFDVTAEVIIKI